MTQAPLIGFEIHDASLWEPSRVLPFIEVMERWGYNALVLHQNDLLDACTQLGLTANYGVSDLRLKKVRNNAAWLNRLVERLAESGAKLFLEIKEPSFHDYALEFYPGLIGSGGFPDPTREDWTDLCRAKVSDLLARVPGIGGLIVNLSSPESRVSLPDHLAVHAPDLEPVAWFDRMIRAFYGPLSEAGKQLCIRDFSYTPGMQSDVLAAVERYGGQVGASVKITAHDYFPEAPENPVIRSGAGPVVLEFEAFGEHTGWGVIPNCRVAELRERMAGFREIGAAGMLVRTSWEAITGANALDGLSAVNVYALPRLIASDVDADELVRDWLREAHGIEGDTAEEVADLLLRSWQIPAAAYWNGKVFPRHSCLPSKWQEGWLSMATTGMGRRDRDLRIAPDDPELSEQARRALFAAKEEATALAHELAAAAGGIASKVPESLARQLEGFAWLPYFAGQFELASKAAFYAARGQAEDLERLPALCSGLSDLADEIARALDAVPDLPHHHRVLLDPDQIRLFVKSLATPDGTG
ncbi:MAG: hypothetical protein AAGD13_15765 [Pseudomonadota bacterium]